MKGRWASVVLTVLLACADSEQPSVSVADASPHTLDPPDASSSPVAVQDAGASSWCRVKALIDTRCAVCHDGAGSAGTPFGLTSAADFMRSSPTFTGVPVYRRAQQRIHDVERPMPPQGGLRPDELALLDGFFGAGAGAGSDPECVADTRDAGVGAVDVDSWPSDCEQIYRIVAHDPDDPSQPYPFAKNSESQIDLVFDAPWGDQPVQARAVRPIVDNRKILHHWILHEAGEGGAFLTGWAPGKDNAHGDLPSDVGMFLPSGRQSLRLNMHYFNLGEQTRLEHDASGVEICIATKPNFRPRTATVFGGFLALGTPDLTMVPARTLGHTVTGHCTVTVDEPVHVLTTSPHGHKLARHMRFAVQKPGQPEIVMRDAPFSFEEQGSFALPEEVVLNTGDVVTTSCTFDNPGNLDVGYGENTQQEMCYNFVVYYPKDALRCGTGLLGKLEGAF